jgi:glycosyltransferase involved in cell wall biosynthesis
MQKLLFVCNDFIGSTMAGPGIRYWELAHALERRGYRAAILSRNLEKGFSGAGLAFTGKTSFANLITWINRSDCVIQPGSPLAILLSIVLRKQIIFDQYDPVIFEFRERKPLSIAGKIHKSAMLFLWKIRQRVILRFGHGFLVANEKQKDFLTGQLTILGYTGKLDTITVLPFGLPAQKPIKRHSVLRGSKIKDTDFLLVWGGGIWDWFDPMSLLNALAKIKMKRSDIKVYFPGLRPPSPNTQKMAVTEAFLDDVRSLNLLDSTVFVNTEWTHYEDRANYLLEADAGISLHRDSMETRFAFRTRMLDYLWADLPIIASKGDSWADIIEKRELGITVLPGDIDSVADAIMKMADDKLLRIRCREHIRYVAMEYQWDELADRLKIK